MISTWVLYSTGTGLLLGLSALAAERLCLGTRRPTRWPWVAAVLGSLLLPIALAGTPGGGAALVPLRSTATAGAPLPLSMDGGFAPSAVTPPRAPSLERALGFGWLLGSVVLTVTLLLSARSIEGQRRTWRYGKLAGSPVRLSTNTGPAVVGFLWSEVVVPDRFLAWDAESQRLLLEHEEEHERAGDPYLLLVALLAVVLMPWNLPLWWQVRRLRFALEVDCDARVLRRRPCLERYGRLLIEVGRVRSMGLVPVAAFSESPSFLERRLRILTAPGKRPRVSALLALCVTILLAPVTLYSIPAPQRPDLGRVWAQTGDREGRFAGEGPRGGPAFEPAREVVERAPTFTPYDVRPELRNRAAFERALMQGRLAVPEGEGSGAIAVLWAFVDESGAVTNTHLVRSSGHPSLDRTAERALRGAARFRPARERGRRVPAWIQVPVTFEFEARATEEGKSIRIPIATTPPSSLGRGYRLSAERPQAPPRGSLPELSDREAFRALLTRSYPPALKEGGIGGTAVLGALVDAAGVVRSTRLITSSGHGELDLAAREILRQSRFEPARSEGHAVDAWVQLPVTFAPR